MPADPPVILERGDMPHIVVGYRIKVTIGTSGPANAWFTEISGLTAEREVFPYEEGGVNDHVHHLPKGVKYGRVTLRRGVGDQALWDWFCGDKTGLYTAKVLRQDVTIVLFSSDYTSHKQWKLKKAFPVKWTGPELKADSNQIAIEAIEFVHEGYEIDDWT